MVHATLSSDTHKQICFLVWDGPGQAFICGTRGMTDLSLFWMVYKALRPPRVSSILGHFIRGTAITKRWTNCTSPCPLQPDWTSIPSTCYESRFGNGLALRISTGEVPSTSTGRIPRKQNIICYGDPYQHVCTTPKVCTVCIIIIMWCRGTGQTES